MRRPGDDQRDDGPLRAAAMTRLVADLAARRARAKLQPGEVREVAASVASPDSKRRPRCGKTRPTP